ncbi:hypothetical protein ABPG72_014885 [Tetrahymena utriculariae]
MYDNQDSDSEQVTDESSSLLEEDYKIYKQVEVDQIKQKHQSEIIILINNDKKNPDLSYNTDQITDIVFKIQDDNVRDEYYCKLISSFKKIRSIKFERDLQFLTCTKSIQLAYNMLRCIDLSQIQEINLSLPIKEKNTEQFSTEQQQNVVWDGDDEVMQEEEDKNKKKSKSKKNNQQKLIEQEKIVKANKYELFQNILKLIQSSCFQLKKLTLIMSSWYSDDSAVHSFQNIFDSLQAILKNNANSIQAFHFNAFQWGFYNKNFTSQSFDQIAQALMQINPLNLQELTLDFGRWGCEEYKNYKIFKDQSVIYLSQALSNFKNLTYLQLNFRSWAYDNESITDFSILSLFGSIQCLSKLIVLNIEVSRWKYQNKSITLQSIKHIGTSLLCLKKLKLLALSLKTWQISTHSELVALLQIHQSTLFIPSLRKEPKIIIEDYYYHCLSAQLIKIKDLQAKKIIDNKKLLYSFKAIQDQYSQQFRQEIIWHVTQLCSNFDHQLLEKQIQECMSIQNVDFNRSWF